MDWELAIEEERAMLKRIVALLLSLADLAELTVTRTPAVRVFVLWLLLAGEAVARNLVTLAPAPCPFHHAGASRADAMRLARRLRNLARAVDRSLDHRGTLPRHAGSRSEAQAIRDPESVFDVRLGLATFLGPGSAVAFAPLAGRATERSLRPLDRTHPPPSPRMPERNGGHPATDGRPDTS